MEGQTAESLAEYAAEAKAEFDAEIARRTKMLESVQDPKTLDDFRMYMRVQGSEGKTYAEARMSLTPEQRAIFDDLAATETRNKRTTAKDDQRTQVRVAGQTVDGDIIATKHTKKGTDLYVVKLAERVSREDYDTLNAGAKRIGGYYSSYRGGGAIPGFQFTTREQAQAFVTLAGGDNTAAVAAAQERRDAYADDRSQTAAERLTEMADRMEGDADESLALDRKANTARRARFAASAEAGAREAKAMAKTMRNVAEALTSGTAKFLDRIRTKSQVELLQTYVSNAKSDELRAKYPTYFEQEKRKGQPPTAETADYAEFPTFTAYRSDLASLGRQLLDVDGTKLFGQRLMKVADDVSDAYLAFAKEPGNLFKLSTFSVRSGEDVRTAIFPSRETAERAIKRSGLTAKAIAFQEKRGVHRIIMSPSLAMEQRIWSGDGDKRITLDPDFAAELVEKMGRANRRGAKVSVPWQFERAYERRKALARMGIETPAEFRAALREFIGLREQAAEADRIKAMERAMVGKTKDGLDFFPTPESVADEMVAAADIQPDMAVLEPSAGMGHIADRIRAAGAEPDVIEMASDRRELLQEKGYHVQPHNDFLLMEPRKFFTYGDVFRAPDGKEGILRGAGMMGSQRVRLEDEAGNRLGLYQRDEVEGVRLRGTQSGYDRILMNPPFSEGRDIQHVRHAFDLLKPGGRLVALMGESAFTNQNKRATEFREWLESVGGTEEKLAEGTFNDPSLPVNTGANARMVVIDKPGAETVTRFSRTTDTARGLTLDEAEAIVGAVRDANPTAPPMIVLESVDQAPSALLRDIESAGAENDVEAAYHEGKVYVFAPHLKSMERAMFVIAHHELRHHGMRSLEGKRLSTVLAGMVMSNPKLRDAAKAKMDDGLAKDMIAGAEEALADMDVAEIQALKGWPKVLAAVRNWLRGVATRLRAKGHVTLADAIDPKDWTDADVAAFVSRAEAVSKGGRAKFGTDGTAFQRAWHGTAARGIERFDTDLIGAGTGEQAFGWGLYFAGRREVADYYRRLVTEPASGKRRTDGADAAPASSKGQLYGVEIPEDSDMLDWNRPLSKQPAGVRKAMSELLASDALDADGKKLLATNPDATGSKLYGLLAVSDNLAGQRGASLAMLAAGIKGIRYLGRTAFEKDNNAPANYVLFDGADAQIEEAVYSRAPGMAQRSPVQQAVRNTLNDLLSSAGAKVSWWDKTLGTQYAKAEKFPAFKRVFARVQQYLEDTSTLANEAASEAKSILPKLETWKDLKNFGIDAKDAQAIAGPVFTGTLTDKKVYSDGELRSKFKLTDKQIGQYREFLAAVNVSLDQAVAADVLKLVGDKNPALREVVIGDRAAFRQGLTDYLTELAEAGDEKAAETLDMVREKYDRIDQLKAEGYAPLMRFGEYKVHVTDESGATLYFGLYESKAAANKMARDLAEDPEFAGATIEQGVLSKEQYKLFSGVPLDSMEMFANAIGADKSEVFQEFLKIAKNNRSALKRLIHRKGTAGFSEDVPRVLASFVTSNARMAAGSLNLAGAKEDAQGIRDGDVQDEAIKLIDTVENPAETAGMFRGLMFMNFIGGSIASAVVNLTQPITMTMPYLSQWGGSAKASSRLMAAGKMAASGQIEDLGLRAALKRAETDGIVSPQEIHHLTAQAMGTWGTNPWLQRAAFIWAAPFSLAEQFNRRATFIAAYNTAKAEGIEDAFGFAEKAVTETQGLYNKGNAPNWARNPIGASALTFKQFSIHYLEWMQRMYRSGPEGKKAVMLALAMLMLAAGTDGLPGADDLDDLIDTLGQAMGYDTNAKKARRDFIAKQLGLGDEMADVLARGLSALPGVPMDVSMRMSMGNLLPGSGLLLRSNTDRSRDLLEVAGPAGGLAKQYMDAAQKGLAGDIGGAALGVMPGAIQNVGKALGMWSTGEARDTMGRRVMEADAVDGLMKFLGFNPQAIARESEKMGMIRRSEQLAKNVEGEIAGRWARAFADGDRDGVAEAKQELADWNEANPDQRIRITGAQIAQRVKKLRQDRAQRFITSISPERRASVAETLQ